MSSLAHEHVLPRDPQVVVVDEKLLQEDNDPIKSEFRSETIGSADGPDKYDWEAEEFRDIPQLVRSIVSFEDDSSLPVTTFRSVSLANFFIPLGSVVSQIGFFRTTTASFSVFFVILVSDPMGRFMARTLPDYTVPLGRFAFSLNPGPWSPKEHALVGIAANAGSQGQWATYLPKNAKLYYGIDYSPAVSLFFGWGAAFIGFSFVAMCRQLLIYDPTYIFPLSLQQVTLYRSMEQNGKEGSERAKRQMKGFWFIFVATILWQFLPEYAFPFTASLALLCWFAPQNHTSNITVQVIVFVAFVITTWLLVPIVYFGDLWGSPTYKYAVHTHHEQRPVEENGSSYPFSSLLDKVGGQQVFNQTKVLSQYDEVGLAYAGAQYMWGIFFWFASLFFGPKLVHIYKARRARKSAHTDRLTKLIQVNYRDITLYEWIAMFTIPFVTFLVVVIKGGIYMPLFTYFIRTLSLTWSMAQDFKSYNTAGIQYALVGPTRLFDNSSIIPSPTDSYYSRSVGAIDSCS
ncbi:OPT oligopeptide transporter protein-domain-containing protein [Mycena epipterygia]|nr:OPT oligopeptide transporter protein-domain-containing protein [Mycena epipterygia]